MVLLENDGEMGALLNSVLPDIVAQAASIKTTNSRCLLLHQMQQLRRTRFDSSASVADVDTIMTAFHEDQQAQKVPLSHCDTPSTFELTCFHADQAGAAAGGAVAGA